MKDGTDNLAYFFEDQENDGYAVFINCLDNKLNLLTNVKASYASFLQQECFGNEEILVCIRGVFFIFSPNGEIKQEVPIIDPGNIDKLKQVEIEVEDVSDTLKYFVFKQIEKVYELATDGEKRFISKNSF